MSKLTVHLPNRPKGEPIEVPPYGFVKNGESVEVEGLEEDQVVGDTSVELLEYEWEDLSLVENQNFQEEPTVAPVKAEDMDAPDQVKPSKAANVKKETS